MLELEVNIGKKEYLPNGSTIETNIINPLNLADFAGDTAHHEALHAATAPEKVESVSIVPGPGYLGITRFNSFDAAAAAAPHAYGENGTGWDNFLIEASGHSVSGASAEAKARLDGKSSHINVLSRYLQLRKSISGAEVRSVLQRVDNGNDVLVKIKKPNGNVEEKTEKGVKSEVILVDFTDLDKAA